MFQVFTGIDLSWHLDIYVVQGSEEMGGSQTALYGFTDSCVFRQTIEVLRILKPSQPTYKRISTLVNLLCL